MNFRKSVLTGLFIFVASAALHAEGPPPIVWKQKSHSDRVNTVAFSPDGSMLVSGGSDRLIHFYNATNGTIIKTFNAAAPKININAIENAKFSPDGSLLATCSYRKIEIWRVADGALLRTLTNHTDWVLSLAFSVDGAYMASGSFDHKIFLWRTSDWSIRQTFSHNGQVRAVSYSSDNVHLATGAGDSDVRIWHVPDGPLHEIYVGHWGDVESVAFSPNGQIIASGSQDHTIKLWNMNTGTLLRTLSGHNYFVYNLAFTSDGQTLGSVAGTDNTVKLWRVSDGALVANYTEETREANTIAFSNSGLLAYGRTDGTVVVAWPDGVTIHGSEKSGSSIRFKVNGKLGNRFAIETSTNFVNWTAIQTNTFGSGPYIFSQSLDGERRFYRATRRN